MNDHPELNDRKLSPKFPSAAVASARRKSSRNRTACRVSFGLIVASAIWANLIAPGAVALFMFWTGVCGFAVACIFPAGK